MLLDLQYYGPFLQAFAVLELYIICEFYLWSGGRSPVNKVNSLGRESSFSTLNVFFYLYAV